ncbi:GNAT family N-acetyltransferase [Jiulongibacter sp. NS-SX5]|uniref:GNAT family N-acetyltransferase n=1 Tax=Jiulongibacter sp. NS-SX5 TaxID=3463854 RepID=UPI004057D670
MTLSQKHQIETPRLLLLSGTEEVLNAAIKGDPFIRKEFGIEVAHNWSIFGVEALKFVLEKLKEKPESENWWTYFPVLKETQTLIGSGGFKGAPDEAGRVEIGYEIAEAYQGKGLATEMASNLVNYAFGHRNVKKVIAHTLGETNASTSVLTKCGFHKSGELTDPEEGIIWRWETNRKIEKI